jgi:hypothetical protein
MIDQLQQLLQPANLQATLYPPTSRYYGAQIATIEAADGRTIAYLRRRFVPPPERFALLQEHTVMEGERIDHIAAMYLSDPEQFWRICDANAAMHPDELTETPGRKLRITLPEGIPNAALG